MNKIDFKLPAGDLASRHLAIGERHKLEGYLRGHYLISVDLSGVSSISESYSDELFGILVAKYGVEDVLLHIRIQNAEPAILRSIATVIKRRSVQLQRTVHA